MQDTLLKAVSKPMTAPSEYVMQFFHRLKRAQNMFVEFLIEFQAVPTGHAMDWGSDTWLRGGLNSLIWGVIYLKLVWRKPNQGM